MILFAADSHYGAHPGKTLRERLPARMDIRFSEDDWSCLDGKALAGCSLLILNAISGSENRPLPPASVAAEVREYLRRGGNLLLLHGGSAAFWHCDWWRPLMGYRWVRENDPDGFAASFHPRMAYRLRPSKSRHELAGALRAIDIPEDELYQGLEQTAPLVTLMEADSAQGTFPMCYHARTPWDGNVIGYLPGHDPRVVAMPENVENCVTLIDWLS